MMIESNGNIDFRNFKISSSPAKKPRYTEADIKKALARRRIEEIKEKRRIEAEFSF
jgi:hypothetical protein